VNENKVKTYSIFAVISGLLLSIIFSWIGAHAIFSGSNLEVPGNFFYPIISILLSFLLSCSIGLYYDESSKIGGIFLVFFLIPLIISYAYLRVLNPDLFLFGLLAGAVISGYYVINHHHEILAKYTKYTLKIFTGLIMLILFYNFFYYLPTISIEGLLSAYYIDKFSFISYILNIIIVSGIYFWLMNNIIGIDASEVFVFGPHRSGKTYFMLGMYNQFVNFFEGYHNEVIFCGLQEEEKSVRLETYLGQLEKKEPIKSNVRDMVGIYTFIGKKWGFKSIDFTILDYAGEWVHDLISKIDPEIYKGLILKLSGNLNMAQNTIASNIGTMEFLESIKKNNRDVIPAIIEDIVLCFIYSRLVRAGKIILLVDGDAIAKNDGQSRDELTRLFGYYSRIMQFLGKKKQYAFVITKTDKIIPIEEIGENSLQAKKVEEDIFTNLRTITTFKAIEGIAGSIPIHFFTVSVNAMKQRDEGIIQIFPWRIGEVAKFEF